MLDELLVHAKNGIVAVVPFEPMNPGGDNRAVPLTGVAAGSQDIYKVIEGQFGLSGALVMRKIALYSGYDHELQVRHGECARARDSIALETTRDDGHRGFSHLLDLDHVVDHPRRARPSIGRCAYDDIAFLTRLLYDFRRVGIASTLIELYLEVLKLLLKHPSRRIKGDISAVSTAPN